MSFFSDYFDIADGAGETAVNCPFDHYTTSGLAYKESNPSAHVNTSLNLFHCKVCRKGYNEVNFISKILDCNVRVARKLQRCFATDETVLEWDTQTELTEASIARALELGISEEVLRELKVKTPTGSYNKLAFPAFMFGHLIDVRTYDPGQIPKVKSRMDCPSGVIIPFDTWVDTNRITIICAGEKDMAVARTHGFNAITITGGERAIPNALTAFKGKKVAICYDNDEAGIQGAKDLARALYPYCEYVKVVTNFHAICNQKGEDITDFFTKYHGTREQLINLISSTEKYVLTEEELSKPKHPMVDLRTATLESRPGKVYQSNVQVVALSDQTFTVPTFISALKIQAGSGNDLMAAGECREWEFTEETCHDILHMIDNNFKEDVINANIKDILKIMRKESYIKIDKEDLVSVSKCYVTDLFETSSKDTQPMEYQAYAVDCMLESGQKYLITYRLVPHPYKGQVLVMIITDAVKANDSVSNFTINDKTKELLKPFQEVKGTVSERMHTLTEKAKGLIGYDGNNTLIQTIDLAYHAPLQFNFGTHKNVRGYLDTIIVGESRVGKSSTADALRKTYELGVFTSLAGNSATIPGLVGGSNKTASGFQTRAGIIPQNHRGLIIFEEFGKSNANITRELTDIRSSNEVRITRVAGSITLPAMVRMIALTNVKSNGGIIRSIASYPNGISVLSDLIDTAEDIARYDIMLVLADKGTKEINPFWEPEQPFTQEQYQARVRWAWSRTADQIQISKDVGLYIMNNANNLNKIYDSHIKIFGTEAWKKLARLSIAIAAYLVSTDDSYEHIVVTEEHVDYAVEYFISIYDNTTFKLKEYVDHEKLYTTIDDEGVHHLQNLYLLYPGLVLQLEQCSSATKNMLGAGSGLGNDDLNSALNALSRNLFVRFQNHDIIPTERFRIGMGRIERNFHAKKIGEI